MVDWFERVTPCEECGNRPSDLSILYGGQHYRSVVAVNGDHWTEPCSGSGGVRVRYETINPDVDAAREAFWVETNWDDQPKGYTEAGTWPDVVKRVLDAGLAGGVLIRKVKQ